VWASCTFPFTLAKEVAISRVVADGSEQHAMHCELLTLVLIPNVWHTRLPQYLQVINKWPQVDINTVAGLLWPGDQYCQHHIFLFLA
jgi:hypothetical protein